MASPSGTGGAAAREKWENAYDEAMQWRDWETCNQLLDEREDADWYRDTTPRVVRDRLKADLNDSQRKPRVR